MYLEVYIDVIFVINLLIDIVLLKLLEKIGRLDTRLYRIVFGGVIGGISACIMSLLPMFTGIIKFVFLYIVTGYLMIRAAFPAQNFKDTIKNLFVLFMLTYSLGGLLNSLYYHTNIGYYMYLLSRSTILQISAKKLFLLAPVALGSMVGLVYLLKKIRHQVQIYYEVELIYQEEHVLLKGLLDTGNGLREPFSQKPVSVVCYEDVKGILPISLAQFIEKYYQEGDVLVTPESMKQYAGIRWIPYHSIGKEQGMLLGIVIPEMVIGPYWKSKQEKGQNGGDKCKEMKERKYKKVIVGIYQGKLSSRKDYQMILHKDFI